MASVKTPLGIDTVTGRIRYIRRLANPLGEKPLGWKDFARFAGVAEGSAKHWEQRGQISHDSAVRLADRLTAAGYPCTPEWIRSGTGEPPRKATKPAGLPAKVSEAEIVYSPTAGLVSPEEIATLAQLVTNAIRATVETNELHTGRDGHRLLWRAVAAFRDQLVSDGLDEQYVAELDDAISQLKRIKQRRLDPPNNRPSSPSGSST